MTDAYLVEPVTAPVRASVRPPGSKSITNRALVLGALAEGGVTRLWGCLDSEDTDAMREALRALGVMIDDVDDPWLVLGTGGRFEPPERPIDVRASGTTARFVTAVSALVDAEVEIDGTERMRQRPIGDLTDALQMMGVVVETAGGFPPVRLRGRGSLAGGEVRIEGSRSSQFLTGLLMVAPLAEEPVDITVTGRLVSRPYVDGTVDLMRRFGAVVEERPGGYRVEATGYRKTHLDVEADASAAAYPAVAAAITGGEMAIHGIPIDSIQPDLALLDVLVEMGCDVERRPEELVVRGPAGPLGSIDVDMENAPDAALALATACLFADGPSRIRGLSTLRLKETDRLAALETELRRVGATAHAGGDTLEIRPGPLRAARVLTYDDHRMAMSFALVGLAVPGIEIDDPGCVAKTWPDYFAMLEAIRG